MEKNKLLFNNKELISLLIPLVIDARNCFIRCKLSEFLAVTYIKKLTQALSNANVGFLYSQGTLVWHKLHCGAPNFFSVTTYTR